MTNSLTVPRVICWPRKRSSANATDAHVHRITQITDTGGSYDKGLMIAELDGNQIYGFDCHLLMIRLCGCLGLDAMWQLVGFFPLWPARKGGTSARRWK